MGPGVRPVPFWHMLLARKRQGHGFRSSLCGLVTKLGRPYELPMANYGLWLIEGSD